MSKPRAYWKAIALRERFRRVIQRATDGRDRERWDRMWDKACEEFPFNDYANLFTIGPLPTAGEDDIVVTTGDGRRGWETDDVALNVIMYPRGGAAVFLDWWGHGTAPMQIEPDTMHDFVERLYEAHLAARGGPGYDMARENAVLRQRCHNLIGEVIQSRQSRNQQTIDLDRELASLSDDHEDAKD